MAKLLVVEDDRMFAALICHALREQGHVLELAGDHARARHLAFANQYDGIVLDVNLPGGSGLSVVEELRREGRATPVLMLTGQDQPADVVRGLDLGADDYLGKPFDPGVLCARVRALVRRGGAATAAQALTFGDVLLERGTYKVMVGGRRLQCTPKEFTLLAHFVEHAERVVSRAELLAEGVGDDLRPRLQRGRGARRAAARQAAGPRRAAPAGDGTRRRLQAHPERRP
jgi:DNA-binding response OmpR family regulator